jgi:UDP-glucose 4-epimerase
MKILIIGINGFLGRHIGQRAIQSGWETHGIYHQHTDNIPDGVVKYPLTKLTSLPDTYDGVIIATGNYTQTQPELVHANIQIPLLVSARFTTAKLVFVSSVTVYGPNRGVIRENSPIQNPTIYGQAKISGEFIISAADTYSIVRLTSLYGIGMRESLFIPTAVHLALQNQVIPLVGYGKRQQNYLHVRDAARIVISAFKYQKSGIFIGADRLSYTNKQMADLIRSKIGHGAVKYAGRETQAPVKIDGSVSRKILDWSPQISLTEGIFEMIDYYGKNQK